MMDKAVDHGCGHLVIRKDTAPFRELQVSRLAYLHGKHHLHTVCANRPQIFLRLSPLLFCFASTLLIHLYNKSIFNYTL